MFINNLNNQITKITWRLIFSTVLSCLCKTSTPKKNDIDKVVPCMFKIDCPLSFTLSSNLKMFRCFLTLYRQFRCMSNNRVYIGFDTTHRVSFIFDTTFRYNTSCIVFLYNTSFIVYFWYNTSCIVFFDTTHLLSFISIRKSRNSGNNPPTVEKQGRNSQKILRKLCQDCITFIAIYLTGFLKLKNKNDFFSIHLLS